MTASYLFCSLSNKKRERNQKNCQHIFYQIFSCVCEKHIVMIYHDPQSNGQCFLGGGEGDFLISYTPEVPKCDVLTHDVPEITLAFTK